MDLFYGLMVVSLGVSHLGMTSIVGYLVYKALQHMAREGRGNRDSIERLFEVLAIRNYNTVTYEHEQGRILRGLQETSDGKASPTPEAGEKKPVPSVTYGESPTGQEPSL